MLACKIAAPCSEKPGNAVAARQLPAASELCSEPLFALYHQLGMEYLIEFFLGKEAKLDACLLQRDALLVRLLCCLCGVLVADVRG